ncbi:MAG: hypothetical protein QM809_18840 [Gordonia sp. (in: high G+C Gram-positive bacteria)]|uniref:hypothetical protein n=1 Tax=Gordonia sp. (in: high G+C Gram-positive bacteria) TaxID=84139 RepID=UPI0039E5CE8B
MSYGGNGHLPTQPIQPDAAPQYVQQPPHRGPSTVLLVSIICITLAVTAIVVTFLVTRTDDAPSNAQETPGAVVHTEIRETKIQTEVQTVAPNVPAAPAPAPANNTQAALQAGGFVYPCDSSVYRQRTGTTCEWARDVQSEISRRGGGFSGVGIYSRGAGTTIYTSCYDQGYFYQCTGRNSTIAVVK